MRFLNSASALVSFFFTLLRRGTLFNSCCDISDNQSPVVYKVDHKKAMISQQSYYLTRDDNQGVCDIPLYL